MATENKNDNRKFYCFPLTVSGKFQFEQTFRMLEKRGDVREVASSDCYRLEFISSAGNSNRYGGIRVIV